MVKKNQKVLIRAEQIITKYKDDDSRYYHELVKSYKEYKSLKNIDKTTNDLYIEHINRLCEFIVERKNSNIIIAFMLLIFIFMVGLTTYSTYRYYKISTNLKNNIIKANSSTNLIVAYKDLENFNAFELSDEQNYIDLKPLLIKLSSTSSKSDNYQLGYNVYIIEENEDIDKSNLLNRDAFLYNIKCSTKDTGIKSLKDAKLKNNKILIYSGILNKEKSEIVEIRMWIDKNTKIDYKNKTYRFKLYVDGYVI